MKITIAHSKTKRRIDGTFRICGSRADLALLAKQIERALADAGWSYGWVTIESIPVPYSDDTPSVGWDAP